MKSICIYCGSSSGLNANYRKSIDYLVNALIRNHISLVYGGADVGLMGYLANTMLAAGGHVTGVIPEGLVNKEIAHQGLTDLKIVSSMHERKKIMAELSDGFIALPGGIGTLEEIFEAFTWSQLGIHHKPCALLNIDGYYDHIKLFLQHAVNEMFLKPVHQRMIMIDQDINNIMDFFGAYIPSQEDKWLSNKSS